MPGALRLNCLNRAGYLLFFLVACTPKPEPPPEAPGVQSAHEQAFSRSASPSMAMRIPTRDELAYHSAPAAKYRMTYSWPPPHFPSNAAHIDSLLEARKALSDELSSTMFPIANDVKVQVEFNPALVAEYRLIGYETRMLNREDFKNDKVDAGDIGAGHSVAALYELNPPTAKKGRVDPLRYRTGQDASMASDPARLDEIAFIKIRYKLPGESTSRIIEEPVRANEALATIDSAPADQRFAVAVAAFAQRLRGESALDGYGYAEIAALAKQGRGSDPEGYRAEFIRLVNMAESLGAVAQR